MDICINNNNNFWPQLTDYKRLYNENPDCIFILNKRDPNNLLNSFKNYNNLLKRIFNLNPELFESLDDTGFINLVNKHYNNVENFFSKTNNTKFISYNIEKDNIFKLKKYIDIKNITELPKENITKNKK